MNLHTGHAVITIACNMKPRARIDKSSIPTLKNIVRIIQVALQCIQGVTCAKKKQSSVANILNINLCGVGYQVCVGIHG